ncbi:MAG: hypothetical protein ACK502_07370 [Alphaproteobacteria bacterium]
MRVLEELQKSSIDVSQSVIDRAAITDFFVRNDAFFLQLLNLPFVGGNQNLTIRSDDTINQLLDFKVNQLLLLL